jgi:asparagine synthase (glutamine-hydrolysing)
MCGIAGILALKSISKDTLFSLGSAMSRSLNARGPDSFDSWHDNHCPIILFHRRLAIQDLSPAGHQPMISNSGRYVLSYNGEIYNHRGLRKRIEKCLPESIIWKGTSDTETLLTSIEVLGLRKTLQEISGMFAFCLWDRQENALTILRDRFGEKPLYWGIAYKNSEPIFVFSSDLSSLHHKNGFDRLELSSSSIARYFKYGYVPGPTTIFKGIFQLPPGHLLSFNISDIASLDFSTQLSIPWWEHGSLLQTSTSTYTNPTEAYDQIEQSITKSVSNCALADVPIGSFLSGGIDSSLITALYQKTSSEAIRTFTISFPDAGSSEHDFDESMHAESIARYLGTEHTTVPLTSQDALNIIPSLASIYSEPFADSSQIPTSLVCREAHKSGLKVALSGDGADELFGGYNRYRIAPAILKLFGSSPSSVRRLCSSIVQNIPFMDRGLILDKRNKIAAAIASSSSIQSVYQSICTIWGDVYFSHLSETSNYKPSDEIIPNLFPAEELMYSDLITYLPSDILVKVDRASMFVGLEVRSPYLDYSVAKQAWSLPLNLKIPSSSHNDSKWVLRQILYKYVPKGLIDRPKSGFAMPIAAWLRGPLRSWAEQLLDPSLLDPQIFPNPHIIHRTWKDHLAGKDNTSKIWTVLMWQSWFLYWRFD